MLSDPMYGISKQTYPHRTDKADAWLLRLFYIDGIPTFQKSLAVGKDSAESLSMLQALRDDVLKEAMLGGFNPHNDCRHRITPRRISKSGINGVQLYYDTAKVPRFTFTAYCNDANKKTKSINAGVLKWGWLGAFERCIVWRRSMDITIHKWSPIPPVEALDLQKVLYNCLEQYLVKYPEIIKHYPL